MTTKRTLITLLVLFSSIAAGAAYYLHNHKPPPTQQHAAGGGFPVLTTTVSTGQLIDEISSIGTLEAQESAALRSEVAGNILAVFFKEGQPVKKGDLLLTVDDSVLQTEAARAKATYEIAKTTLRRNTALRKTEVISAQALDEAVAAVNERKANYENTQVRLQQTKITAPFDGIMGLSELSPGDYLDIGGPIANIVDIDPIKLKFNVPEKAIAKLKEKQTVYVTVDAWPERQFTGSVYAIDPSVDLQTRMISIKAQIANSDGALRPGMFAYSQLRFGIKNDAILIPEEAIIPNGKQSMVMRVIQGKVVSTPVTIGVRHAGKVEITEGLSVGDIIITGGQLKVRDGMPVQSMNPPPAKQEGQATTPPNSANPAKTTPAPKSTQSERY